LEVKLIKFLVQIVITFIIDTILRRLVENGDGLAYLIKTFPPILGNKFLFVLSEEVLCFQQLKVF
jgi:hypothetical protein